MNSHYNKNNKIINNKIFKYFFRSFKAKMEKSARQLHKIFTLISRGNQNIKEISILGARGSHGVSQALSGPRQVS